MLVWPRGASDTFSSAVVFHSPQEEWSFVIYSGYMTQCSTVPNSWITSPYIKRKIMSARNDGREVEGQDAVNRAYFGWKWFWGEISAHCCSEMKPNTTKKHNSDTYQSLWCPPYLSDT